MKTTRFVLVADVGATKCLLALAPAAGPASDLRHVRRFEDAAYPAFEEILAAYMADARAALGRFTVSGTCFAVAGPVLGKRARLTNRDWIIDADRVLSLAATQHVRLVNDFAAAAYGLQWLGADDFVTLQAGRPEQRGPRVVIGAGSGLGVAYLVHAERRWTAIAGEAGHKGFAPENETQAELWRYLYAAKGRVTDEDVLSGPGLAAIHAFACGKPAGTVSGVEAAQISSAADAGDPAAVSALNLFIEIYGAVAGDHALTVLARGGVYVAGGIARRFLDRLRDGRFLHAFNHKRGYEAIMRQMPVHVVISDRLELAGAAALICDRD